jgi:hypothetical protein
VGWVKVKQKDWVYHGGREKQKRIGGEDAAKEFNGTLIEERT